MPRRAAADLLRRADVDHVRDRRARQLGQRRPLRPVPARLGRPGSASRSPPRGCSDMATTPPRLDGAAVIGISQSGRSPDVVRVHRGRPRAGPADDRDHERSPTPRSPPARTSWSSSASATSARSPRRRATSPRCRRSRRSRRSSRPDRVSSPARIRCPELVTGFAAEQLAGRGRFDPLARLLGSSPPSAAGLDLSTACESALKLREISGIPAEAFSPPGPDPRPARRARLRDGPLDRRLGARPTKPGGARRARADQRLARWWPPRSSGPTGRARARRSRGRAAGRARRVGRRGRGCDPGQAAALRLAELRGVDVDSPNGLRKVTLTT